MKSTYYDADQDPPVDLYVNTNPQQVIPEAGDPFVISIHAIDPQTHQLDTADYPFKVVKVSPTPDQYHIQIQPTNDQARQYSDHRRRAQYPTEYLDGIV